MTWGWLRTIGIVMSLGLGMTGQAQAATLNGNVNVPHVPLEAPYGWSSCYVMGDSIALGTARQLPQCWSDAKVGLNSQQALTRFVNNPFTDLTVISMGVNDKGTDIPTRDNLIVLRERVRSPIVIWILPTDPGKKYTIEQVAYGFHDRTIDLNEPDLYQWISPLDHLHPTLTGYALVAMRAEALAWHP
jgi:hypothetical protein